MLVDGLTIRCVPWLAITWLWLTVWGLRLSVLWQWLNIPTLGLAISRLGLGVTHLSEDRLGLDIPRLGLGITHLPVARLRLSSAWLRLAVHRHVWRGRRRQVRVLAQGHSWHVALLTLATREHARHNKQSNHDACCQ
jgi:hypothetical protein